MVGASGTSPQKELPFDRSEYESRLSKIRKKMSEKGLEAVIASIHRNVYYATGIGLSSGHYKVVIIPLSGEPVGVCRFLEESGGKRTSIVDRWETWVDTGDPTYMSLNPAKATAKGIEGLGLSKGRIGIETGDARQVNQLTVRHLELLKKLLPRAQFVDDEQSINEVRLVKSAAEIECFRCASLIVERTVLSALENLKVGTFESSVYAEAMKTAWSHRDASEIRVMLQSGGKSSLIHVYGRGNDRVLRKGDIVFMEIGAAVKGYFSTRIRCASMGEPPVEAKRMAVAVEKALDKTESAMRAGVSSHEVDAACRREIKEAGFGNYFRHRTGYSLGLGWNEGETLCLRENDNSLLQEGMIFHVVPGFWVPELGYGIGISENILVKKDGSEAINVGLLERKLYNRPLL